MIFWNCLHYTRIRRVARLTRLAQGIKSKTARKSDKKPNRGFASEDSTRAEAIGGGMIGLPGEGITQRREIDRQKIDMGGHERISLKKPEML